MTYNKQTAKKKIIGTSGEPVIDPDNYNISLSAALNHYNNVFSLSDYKQNTLDYCALVGIQIPKGIPEWHFRGTGAVCRLLLREQPISAKHIQEIISKISTIIFTYQEDMIVVEKIIEKETKTIQTPDLAIDAKIWLEDLTDSMLLGSITTLGDMIGEYSKLNIPKTSTKTIINYVQTLIDTYNNIIKELLEGNEQTIDAWSNTSRTTFKKLIKELQEFKAYLEKLHEAYKPVKKAKPALSQVANMKYLSGIELFKGLHPKEVIGKSEVWIYDEVYRELIVLRANGKFMASGTSFTNINENKSFKKKLRKPDEILTQLKSMLNTTKKNYQEVFDSIKTTETKAYGRMSEHKIIIEVF